MTTPTDSATTAALEVLSSDGRYKLQRSGEALPHLYIRTLGGNWAFDCAANQTCADNCGFSAADFAAVTLPAVPETKAPSLYSVEVDETEPGQWFVILKSNQYEPQHFKCATYSRAQWMATTLGHAIEKGTGASVTVTGGLF